MSLVLLLGVAVGATVFTGMSWIAAELAWRRLNPLARREVLMNDIDTAPVPRMRQRVLSFLDARGLTRDLDRTLLTITGIYLAFLLVGAIFGIGRGVTVVVALPFAVFATLVRNRRASEMQQALLRSQLLGLFESLASMIESGDTVPGAIGKLATRVEDPLRSELAALSNSHAVRGSLVPGLRAMRERHASRPLALLTAAVEVDEEIGVRLAPVLRQAGQMLERDQELSAEAMAELSQARSEFIGISGVIGGIALLMIVGSAGIARDAYFTPVGMLLLLAGAGNYAFGIFRTLRILRRAREVTV